MSNAVSKLNISDKTLIIIMSFLTLEVFNFHNGNIIK
jgi:hypothetical protein